MVRRGLRGWLQPGSEKGAGDECFCQRDRLQRRDRQGEDGSGGFPRQSKFDSVDAVGGEKVERLLAWASATSAPGRLWEHEQEKAVCRAAGRTGGGAVPLMQAA